MRSSDFVHLKICFKGQHSSIFNIATTFPLKGPPLKLMLNSYTCFSVFCEMICLWKGKTCPKFDSDLTPKKHFCTAWSQRCDQISYRRGEVVDLPGSSRYYHVISKMSIYMFKNLKQFCFKISMSSWLCNPTSYLPICYISVAFYPNLLFLNTVLTIIFGTILIGSENGMVDMTCMKRSAHVQL